MKVKVEAEIERTAFGELRIRLIGNDQSSSLLGGLRLNTPTVFVAEKACEKEVVLKSCSAKEAIKILAGTL